MVILFKLQSPPGKNTLLPDCNNSSVCLTKIIDIQIISKLESILVIIILQSTPGFYCLAPYAHYIQTVLCFSKNSVITSVKGCIGQSEYVL